MYGENGVAGKRGYRDVLIPMVLEFVAHWGRPGKPDYLICNYGQISLLVGKN